MVYTPILKVSCLQYTNLVCLYPSLSLFQNFFWLDQVSWITQFFKTSIDKLFIKRPQLITVEKKTMFLTLSYLGEISLQTRTKLRKSLKGLLNSCKLQIVFKSQRKLSNVFRFKDRLPSDLVPGVAYKHMCGRCNSTYYGETDRHLKVWSGEHIGISLLTFKKTKPSKESAIHVW